MKRALSWLVMTEPNPTWLKFDTGQIFDTAVESQKAGMLAMFSNSSARMDAIEKLHNHFEFEIEVIEPTDQNSQWECVPHFK